MSRPVIAKPEEVPVRGCTRPMLTRATLTHAIVTHAIVTHGIVTRPTLALVVGALLLGGCSQPIDSGAGAGAGDPSAETASADPLFGTVNVFAAASLRDTFTVLGAQFETLHPGSRVIFSFGPSSGLAAQITRGAPADVFAAASTTTMDQVVSGGGASAPATFARNIMEIAVPPGNPAHISGVTDLSRPGVKVAICQAAVPCGVASATVFAHARLTPTPVSQEVDVKGVLTKVMLGEVDAGIVYVTDVQSAAQKVTGVPIPADLNASTSYPIAALTKAPNPAGAKAFTDYVLSSEGARVLSAAGFAKP